MSQLLKRPITQTTQRYTKVVDVGVEPEPAPTPKPKVEKQKKQKPEGAYTTIMTHCKNTAAAKRRGKKPWIGLEGAIVDFEQWWSGLP